MKIDEIKEIAKRHDIKTGKMKKAELILSIQAAEKNNQCFKTGAAFDCNQNDCLWREDCK